MFMLGRINGINTVIASLNQSNPKNISIFDKIKNCIISSFELFWKFLIHCPRCVKIAIKNWTKLFSVLKA